MNIYSFDVSFSTGVISSPYFTLVVNDHNSTTFKFTFDQDGRHVFKLLYPDGTYYVQDIVDDELILGKGVLNQSGNYKFEISLYGEDNRLTTSLTQEFAVRLELVDTDELVSVDDRVPVLDNLIEETNTILQEAKDGKFDGATFIPNVSESGDLSWSNDKGKENPPTVNIMGPPGEPGAVKMQVVDVLPETGETDTIYLVKKSVPNEQNLYDEYVYANGTWEHIGDTSVDLSDYYTKDETDDKLDEKQNTLTAGKNITIDENNVISASGGSSLPIYILKTSIEISNTTPISASSVPTKTVVIDDIYNELSDIINNLYSNGEEGFQLILKSQKWLIPFYCCNILRGKLGIQSEPNGMYFATPYTSQYSITGINQEVGATLGYCSLNLTLSWADNICTVTKAEYSWRQINVPSETNVLAKTNTTSYTPTKDYHPATKKYVDDSISTAITDALGGSY